MMIEKESILKKYYIPEDLSDREWESIFVPNISELMGLLPSDMRYKEERFRKFKSKNLSYRQVTCLSEFILVFNEYGHRPAYYYLLRFIKLSDYTSKYLSMAELMTLYSMVIVLFKNMNDKHVYKFLLDNSDMDLTSLN